MLTRLWVQLWLFPRWFGALSSSDMLMPCPCPSFPSHSTSFLLVPLTPNAQSHPLPPWACQCTFLLTRSCPPPNHTGAPDSQATGPCPHNAPHSKATVPVGALHSRPAAPCPPHPDYRTVVCRAMVEMASSMRCMQCTSCRTTGCCPVPLARAMVQQWGPELCFTRAA